MRSTESTNSIFKLSDFFEIYEEEINRENVYLHSYISHKKVLISKTVYHLLQEKSFQFIDKEILSELITKDIVIPELIDEKENITQSLQNLNKLTIVFDDHHFSDTIFRDIFHLLNRIEYKDICLLFTFQNKNNIDFIKEELPKYSQQLENISILRLEKLDKNSFESKIYIYKWLNNFREEKQMYSHAIVYNTNDFETYRTSVDEENISFKEMNNAVLHTYRDKLVRPKRKDSLSLLSSVHHYLKELPISGFLVDYDKVLEFIKTRKIHKDCIECPVLPLCGGYIDRIEVKCPSFKYSKLKIFSRETEEISQSTITGVSNSLTLKSEILESFEKMISYNVKDHLDHMAIVYLNKEYSKGFIHAKSGKIAEANHTFANADVLAKRLLPQSGFSYNYIQTFITSTKSYLAFKTNKKKHAIDITLEGIRYGVQLNNYEYSEIISLHISQMLMNLSKVYLTLNDLKNWEKTTLSNIHYLLNYDLPEEASGYDIRSLQKTPENLKYFMLVETINQVLTNIVRNDFEPGVELLKKIVVNDLSKDVNKQICEWVDLITIFCTSYTNISDYEIRLSEFYSSENKIIDLSKLKLFLRFMVKNNNKKIYRNIL